VRLAIVQLLSNTSKSLALRDGEELDDSAVSLNPDVIVTDISMRFSLDLKALKELSARGYDIPFVLVSMNPLGADEFIRRVHPQCG